MVEVASRARLRCYRHNHLALAVVALPSAIVGNLNLAAEVLRMVSATLPGGRKCDDPIRLGIYLAAGASSAVLFVEGRHSEVSNAFLKVRVGQCFTKWLSCRRYHTSCSKDRTDDHKVKFS